MSTVIATMSLSLDGVGAGENQTEQRPFGDMPEGVLHRWMFETPDENRAEMDAIVSAGAYVMGRHMFGPVRGEWSSHPGPWRGWWGPNPPYHAPVFVLTHHPRESLEMEGGTVFHFVTDGIHAALERAREAAGERNVHIAGGVSTTRAYLQAGLVDELMLQIAPVVVGDGLRLFEGIDGLALEQLSVRAASLVTHVRYRVVR
ncbi:dihydrofolate reductase family protein [Microbacterium sp. W1N]|uniref:dihydrofolate reductase family protein n=1 Tax=Microbacterium festucae TaxID=2977531 RepID=UPI0021C240C4|nr:dihydrofolate reductase family protein [Microbacterium festucae]MCT9820947.1 dihydrofolate reductase family protein [Microbacterium festucae]